MPIDRNSTDGSPVTVLVADDEPMLRSLVGHTLTQAGYAVIEASDGAAGLEILKSPAIVDVLLSDIRMPGLDGYQLAEAGRRLRPGIGIVLMTGYTDEEMPSSIREDVRLLQKPFIFEQLAGCIREAVEKR